MKRLAGYESGMVQLRDPRLYRLNGEGVCHSMSVEGRLVGVDLRADSAGNPTLTITNENGEISVWEPRSFHVWICFAARYFSGIRAKSFSLK